MGSPWGAWWCAQLPPSHFTASSKCPREAAAWPPSHSQGKVRGLGWGWQWRLTAAIAECGHLSRTVPGGRAAGGWPAEGSRELQRLGLHTARLGPPGLVPTSRSVAPDPPGTSGCMVCPASRVGPGGVCACPKNCHWAPFQPQVARLSAVVLAMPSAWCLMPSGDNGAHSSYAFGSL